MAILEDLITTIMIFKNGDIKHFVTVCPKHYFDEENFQFKIDQLLIFLVHEIRTDTVLDFIKREIECMKVMHGDDELYEACTTDYNESNYPTFEFICQVVAPVSTVLPYNLR